MMVKDITKEQHRMLTTFSVLFGPTEHVAVTDPSLRATGCSPVCT